MKWNLILHTFLYLLHIVYVQGFEARGAVVVSEKEVQFSELVAPQLRLTV